MQERLQKIIARAGVASRRHAEQLIVSGQVKVNGKTVRELGSKADSDADKIEVSRQKMFPPLPIPKAAKRCAICCADFQSASIPSAISNIPLRALCSSPTTATS